MLAEIILGGVVAAVLGYVVLFGGAKKATPPSRDVWEEVARRRGGTYSGPRSAGDTGIQRSMDVRVAHVMVRLETEGYTGSEGPVATTTARARWAVGRGPAFVARPRALFEFVPDLRGHSGLDDAAFERSFVLSVAGSDREAFQYALSPAARRRLLRVLRRASIRSDGACVTVSMLEGVDSERMVDALLNLAGEVASAGANGLDGFGSLPGAKLVRAQGSWDDPTPPELRIIMGRGECTAHLRWVNGALVPRLTYPTRDVFPSFKTRIVAGRVPDLPAGLVTEYAIRLLPELDGSQLHSEEGVLSLLWTTVPTPPALLTGAKLLVELADAFGRVGPFR